MSLSKATIKAYDKFLEEERIKFQIYEGIRDLGYNVSYEELFVLLETLKNQEVKSNEFNVKRNK